MTRRRSVLAMSALGLLPPALMLGSALNTRARAIDNFDRKFSIINNKAGRTGVAEAALRASRDKIARLEEQLEELKDVEKEFKESKGLCEQTEQDLGRQILILNNKIQEMQSQTPKKVDARKLGTYERLNRRFEQKNHQLERARREIDKELGGSKVDIAKVRTILSQEKENSESLRREVERLQRINELFQKSSSRNVAKARGRVFLSNWKNLVLAKRIIELKNYIVEKNEEIGIQAGLIEKAKKLNRRLNRRLNKRFLSIQQITNKATEKREDAAKAHAKRLAEVIAKFEEVEENEKKLTGQVDDLTGQVDKAEKEKLSLEQEKLSLEAKVAQMAAAELSNEKMLENARRMAMVHTQIVLNAFMEQKLREQFKIIAKEKEAEDVGAILNVISSSEAKEPVRVKNAKLTIINHISQKAKVVNAAAVNIIQKTYDTYSRMNPAMQNIINLGLLTLAGISGSGSRDIDPRLPSDEFNDRFMEVSFL